MRYLLAIVSAGVILALAGCTGPATYRYANHILIPPGVKNAAVAQRTVTVPLAASCSSSEDGLRMEKRGQTVRVTVQFAPLATHQPGWLSTWGTSLERSGCVAIGEGAVLAARVAELVPLDTKAVHNLLHPSAAIAGYMDLGPEYRLKVVGPILREGAPPGASAIGSAQTTSGDGGKLTVEMHASKDFLGYETAWFGIQPFAGRPGAQIVFLSAEDNMQGKPSPANKPRLDYFKFSPDAAYYRLFYLTRISQADHDLAVLTAPTRAELEEQTRRFAADPSICSSTAAGSCVLIPRESAVVPHIIVTAAGSEIPVIAGGTVRDALKAAGVAQPAAVLPTLQVRRRYAGGLAPVVFNPSQTEILDLPLSGGEVVRW
ncbi:MAG TPA: hypothetical protein VGV35_04180 [Bryobacteraceae bacterium]|nr:hypothetical protein [Bryobacteraceae bacterium]